MNFYKLASDLEDGISVLEHSSDKISLNVPLSSYKAKADEFLKFLKSSEANKAAEQASCFGKVQCNDPENETGQDNIYIESLSNSIMQDFYLATKCEIDGLIGLISFTDTDSRSLSMIRKGLLEKILLADHINNATSYSDRYLMIVADCLAGIYTFDTVRDYPKAIALYTKVLKMDDGKSPYIEEIAKKRIKCCEMLNRTQLTPPSSELIAKVKEMALTDNFSRTVLACYYITAPEIRSQENYKLYKAEGYKLLIDSVDGNYRPGIALLEYLCKKRYIKNMSQDDVTEFRIKCNPPISENNWYE